jgi:cyclase
MLKKRIVIVLTFLDGVLYRTKKFNPDYRYTRNFIDIYSIDEIILIDISKTKLKKSFISLVKNFVENCNVPIAVGGGITTKEKASLLLSMGVEKIILNTSSVNNTALIDEIAIKHGSQSIIHSIDLLKINNSYKVRFDNNKVSCNYELSEWIGILNEKPIGEILINSIDNDGSLMGYDINLIKKIEKKIKFPILILGGCGNWNHILELFNNTNISAACTQNIYHFSNESIMSLKKFLKINGHEIRN